jgi:penicillin-insensitive murein DD-endopeptidase
LRSHCLKSAISTARNAGGLHRVNPFAVNLIQIAGDSLNGLEMNHRLAVSNRSTVSRWRGICAIVLGLFGAFILANAASAQATQSEEELRRAKVLRALPEDAAKRLFGTAGGPAKMSARSIGSYARGCLAGGKALPVNGSTWQVMRLSRNRMWGHPDLINFLGGFAEAVPGFTGWPGILVGDISQPRGGPMLTGHASHQIGLDADIWLTPMPSRSLSRRERESMSATNVVADNWMDVNGKWSRGHLKVIQLAASQPKVARIFVNPAIKKALCRQADGDRSWLNKVRPMWGHNYHFHIRMACPVGLAGCKDQDAPPDGDGCGAEVDRWLKMQYNSIFNPKPGPKRKPPRVWTLADLPDACRNVAIAE